ncbi:hypothetical protein [Aquibacillus albus]|uniref:Uncharacterized protein n=1 Tax=Aquibacillus albus TaxID=1168171 RepID=A0ABS2N648_9BACI|nr:hypothetical protein [Aquibacillus albus]MBM7573622.1 hypothetical protein [Aquibacillus albus]
MYYFYHPSYYHPPVYHPGYYPNYRQMPPVDPNLLYQSANETKKLMEDASTVLDKLADSKEFDTELMYAAQASDYEEVERLIHSLGITSNVNVQFNPDGLRLEFQSQVTSLDCCHLTITLRWR